MCPASRDSIVASRGESEPSGVVVSMFLEREARRDLAMRSLDLVAGEAEDGAVPIGERVIEREHSLPAPVETALIADGQRASARMTMHGVHSATWADLPDSDIATVIYGRAWLALPELASIRFPE